jgi:hypothetical protein
MKLLFIILLASCISGCDFHDHDYDSTRCIDGKIWQKDDVNGWKQSDTPCGE